MNINRVYDEDLIRSIVFDPSLLDSTNYSGVDLDSIKIDVNGACYLSCFISGSLAGICIFNKENTNSVSYHPNLLPQYRGKHSTELTIKALKWLYENASDIIKVNVKIPESMPALVRHSKMIGFRLEGVDRKSIIVDGHCIDQICLGITRNEIGDLNVNN